MRFLVIVTILSVLLGANCTSLDGCLQYSNSYVVSCNLCDTARLYYKNGSRCYKCTEPFCASINSSGQCTQCEDGFFLSTYSNCLPITQIYNCATYSNNGKISWCSTCQSGYELIDASCMLKIEHCNDYTWWGSCSRCADGFSLSSVGKCISKIPNCAIYYGGSKCLICDQGYGVNATKDKCLNTIPRCEFYNSSGSCLFCSQNYTPSLNQLSCLPNIANCADMSNSPVYGLICATCEAGFIKSSNQKMCEAVSHNCLKFNNATKICDHCMTGYIWFQPLRACVWNINLCTQYVSNPALSSSYGCIQCASGYVPSADQSRCVVVVKCTSTQSLCAQTNKCVTIPTCCATHDGCGKCVTFKPLTGWSQTFQTCYTIPSTCPTSFDTDTLQCRCSGRDVWDPVQKTCISIPNCCAEYDCSGRCVAYKPGFGWCKKTNSCYAIPSKCPFRHDCQTLECTCPVGYRWNSSRSTCIEVPWCCDSYDDTGKCVTFIRNTGWCAQRSECFNIPYTCPNGFDANNGSCLCPIGQSWCLRSRRCVDIPECCARHNNCGSCITYKTNYGWCAKNNRCYQKPIACLDNHDCATGECICPAGFSWNPIQGKCVEVFTCCSSFDCTGKCVSYKPGSGWCAATNSCYNIPTACPNPTNHDCATGLCKCNDNETWCAGSNRCVTPLECCQKSDDCGNCLQFKSGKAFCDKTKQCYDIPSACAANHDCATGNCVCDLNKVWNPIQQKCVSVPECCTKTDQLGNCIEFKDKTGWCTITNSCYFIPVDCPSNHNCQTGQCTCPPGYSWCGRLKSCVQTPSCCETTEGCGVCSTVKSGFSICSATQQCVAIPTSCPNDNDGCGNCRCSNPNQTWCAAQGRCFNKPINCARFDDCGNCLECSPNFYLVQGVCLPPADIPRCTQYSADFQKCEICSLYYYLANGGLACYVANCVDYNPAKDQCNTCANNYMAPNSSVPYCLPKVPECSAYNDFTYGDLILRCKECRFPYFLDKANNRCIIPRCLEYETGTDVLTCKTCENQKLKSPNGYICFRTIEKCIDYAVTNNSFRCSSCELGYKPNDTGFLCLSGVYFIGEFNAANGDFVATGFGIRADASAVWGYSLVWGAINMTSSSWMWYLTSYDGRYYTLRLQVIENGQEVPYYITDNGSSLTLTQYFTFADDIKWVIEQAYPDNNNVWYIKSFQSGKYLGYSLNLSSTPTPFFFK